ncbi:tRNA-dihydrouridine(16/17) synthase [NAD(P)(+)] [Malassezia japonica]|uniref:tRNA-dihydrouridine synthase n=1 Tax=Malassezia japonica TaxID=223818 RepID=A0AAF0F001_9BASI|nr:tRNA-dihydrouridine(16/17) synthase [NAD(P)(+)] [Malassezia japonica]WFD38304.1 tRNA-dihydrouridine(16/17) synthase [NAD(P)(+)] [Malassezia japonica]
MRPWFQYGAAPMVNQSDVAFRLTAVQYGATATWTETWEGLVRALEIGRAAPENRDVVSGEPARQIVQLAGDDGVALAAAARRLAPYADGFDVNLGCPQRRAQEGHYGGYLLGQRDWPLVESITSALVHSTPLPVSVKLRLCDYAADTPALAVRLARAGAAVVTLHARHVAPNRRRANAAKLTYVYDVRTALLDAGLHASQPGGHCHVLSNGNVRGWADVVANLGATHADGVMVGEPLLEQPHLFAPSVQKKATALDALDTYLGLCEAYPHDSLPMQRVHQHVHSTIPCAVRPTSRR